ncbi:PAS and ANTAR domain-containing protein [Nocardia amikacinitolerans]|uniref:PAS and ANTAR domain-containing protein n=1 Tax=Nocardia amikacinitolerans TaxID=756689 RepID=UPI0020A5660A|nr:PAS and ANTAR domain-containing protein [Nocardia amikacinitolerans]MCP2291258.1 PAS domain S-box-containing protein [Nocardia amikacinitolerans]
MIEGSELSPRAIGALGSVIGVESCANAGEFRFFFADQRWEWSDEVARMYGYEPGAVEPTTTLLLSHKHPDDRELVESAIAKVVDTGEPFCSRHRIIDTEGREHPVIVIGDYQTDQNGAVIGTAGYYIDLTDALEGERKDVIEDVLPELIESRAAIEQAKGVLSLVYAVSADQAFAILRWRSQHTNTKLRDLAQQLVLDARDIDADRAGLRTRFDHVLLTAHERVVPEVD